MTKAVILMDNCGLETIIEANSNDDGKIKIVTTSKCKSIQKMAQEIDEIDPFEIVGKPIVECPIHQIASKHIRHTACIVPSAFVRVIEVEAGMALSGNSSISIEKE